MQLTNDQIKAVSEWIKEHGIDEHLISKFEGDWMKKHQEYLDGRTNIWGGVKLKDIPNTDYSHLGQRDF